MASWLLMLTACSSGDGQPTAPVVGAWPTTSLPVTPSPGNDAWIDVAVANLWAEPDQARPIDTPSLASPVDMGAWLAAMTVDDRRWLVDRLVTQALYGDRVTVVDVSEGWSKVVVHRQPTSLDPRGYPGWLPTRQLTALPPARATASDAVVTRPSTSLRDVDGDVIELSFNTRLAVLDNPAGVMVALPGGDGPGQLESTDIAILTPDSPPPTGKEVVRSAEQFLGVDYLWAGTSGSGWDCSGFTSAVYAAHGVVIPRDAHDQAGAGTPVDRADLRPGDLLFFATGPDRTSIHHVGMYVGDGRMIQAPATGRRVETVAIDQPGLMSSYWGARRYLPPAG